MAQERRWISPASRRRWPTLLLLCAVAAGVHLAALSGLQWAWPQPDAAPEAVTRVELRELPAVVLAPPPPAGRAAATAPVAPVPVAVPAASPRPRRRAPAATREPALTAAEPPRIAEVLPAPLPAEAGQSDAESIPDYRTLLPPAADLRYQARRGTAVGSGDLRWRPGADRYELSLTIELGGPAALAQSSQGGFDEAGLAPVRFTDKRFRRQVLAANFQRDAGQITFSGPQVRYPLRAGSQDRLSWMLQLPAIVAAEPSLRESGAKVVMNVASANGDVAIWVFRCQGTETADGPVEALVYQREPRGLYDTAVAVWLDPRRAYLPVQAIWKAGANDAGFELRLQEMTPYP